MIPAASTPAREHAPATWRDFVALTKPRVMSLVIFTAVTGLLAARVPVQPALAGIAVLCIALGAGGSAALNMGFEGEIDARMKRTRDRPVPAGRVQASDAIGLGVVLSLFSVAIMGLAANWLAAALLAFTIVFYAVAYTRWLKPSTPQNIVWGGLAGALPPAVGWAAAAGAAPLNAWLLVAIIFVWTPPHFWALALLTRDDYAAAGLPMLPVVKGSRHTRRQILIYAVVMALLALAPAATGLGGALYLAAALIGGAAFVLLAWRLDRTTERGEAVAARRLFKVSIAYLFALFAALLIEAVVGRARRSRGSRDQPVRGGRPRRPRSPRAQPRHRPGARRLRHPDLRHHLAQEGRRRVRRARLSNAALALSLAGVFVAMVGAGFAAVPLYRAFCQATGFAGTVRRGGPAPSAAAAGVAPLGHGALRHQCP